MNRSLVSVVLIALLLVAVAIWLKPFSISLYHCGVCGAQKWERYILWIDFSENDYDEAGIEERWTKAHRRPCQHVWLKGAIEQDDGRYWPPLHLLVAKGTPLERVLVAINAASFTELARKDILGRTVMHWAVIYPDPKGRALIEELLTKRGIGYVDKDSDGLSAADWKREFDKTPFSRD